MVRTIEEVLNLIKEKVNNAENDLASSYIKNEILPCPEKINKLLGEIEAYNDVIILIETSHIIPEGNKNENKNSND